MYMNKEVTITNNKSAFVELVIIYVLSKNIV